MKISYIAQSIKDLKVISLILAMQARQDIDLGEAYLQGDKWRGGFGQSLKMLSCLNSFASNECNSCSKRPECFYYLFFAIDIPHPYIIETNSSTNTTVLTGQTFTLQLKLIGIASKETDRVIHAFERLGGLGIGAKRGRFELITVHSSDIHLYDFFEHNFKSKSIILQLETPLKIKQDQRQLSYDQFSFESFLRLLLKRIINLNNIYGFGKQYDKQLIEEEKNNLLKKAMQIKDTQEIRWIDLERYSSRQSKRLKIGGIVGAINLKGDLKEIYPILKIGEVIHAGIHTTSGFGRYRII